MSSISISASSPPSSTNVPLTQLSAEVWQPLLQKSYSPTPASPSAVIVHKEGVLRKFGSKVTASSINERYFVLTSHSLQYHKQSPLTDPAGVLNLIGSKLERESDESAAAAKAPSSSPGCCFSITVADTSRRYMLVAETPAQRERWIEALTYSCDDTHRASLHTRSAVASEWPYDENLQLQGWLWKVGDNVKTWRKRWFIYCRYTHTLHYFKSPVKEAQGFAPIDSSAAIAAPFAPDHVLLKGSQQLQKHSEKTLSLLPPPSESIDPHNVFAYTQSVQRCYVLLAASAKERDEWCVALKTAVEYVTPNSDVCSVEHKKAAGKAADAAAAKEQQPTLPPIPPPPATIDDSDDDEAISRTVETTITSSARGEGEEEEADEEEEPPPPPAEFFLRQSHPTTANASAPPPPATTEDDDWADTIVGRPKGESIAYVNVAAAMAHQRLSSAKAKAASSPQLSPQPSPPTAAAQQPQTSLTPQSLATLAEEDPFLPPPPIVITPAPASATTVTADDAASTAAAADLSPRKSTVGDLKKVDRALRELCSSERVYVRGLNTLCDSYLLRFRKSTEIKELQPQWFEALELARDYPAFTHVETIRELNVKMLAQIEAVEKKAATTAIQTAATAAAAAAVAAASIPPVPPSPSSVSTPTNAANTSSNASTTADGSDTGSDGDIAPAGALLSHLSSLCAVLRHFVPFLKVYTLFAASYDETMRAFTSACEKRQQLRAFVQLQDACERPHSLKSLFITPIQRLARYVLLLETIVKHAPSSTSDDDDALPGLSDLLLALEEMRRVATIVNDSLSVIEAKQRAVEIQKLMDKPILEAGRFLVREGVLKKLYDRAEDTTTARFLKGVKKKEAKFTFFLFNDVLVRAESSKMSDRLVHKQTLPLEGLQVEDIKDEVAMKEWGCRCAWNITFSASGSSASTTLSSQQRAAEEDADMQSNPAATTLPAAPPQLTHLGSSSMLLSPTGGDRKSMLLYAATNEIKYQWIADMNALISKCIKDRATLGTPRSLRRADSKVGL